MIANRLWQLLFLGIALVAATTSNAADDTQSANTAAPATLTDFLILAIKPEGDDSDYKLIELGETKFDANVLATIAKVRSRGFLNLGIGERDYDEAAERAQCSAACKANTRCRDFAYVRPSETQPVGVCRLKALVETAVPFGVMSPVIDALDHPQQPAPATTDGATKPPVVDRPTPPVGEDSTPVAESAPPVVDTPLPPREEIIPPPPALPAITVERAALPPRQVPTEATDTPADITPTAPPESTPVEATPVTEAPTVAAVEPPPEPIAAAEPDVEIPPEKPALPERARGLPIWLALGAVGAMFAGAGVYWRSHRVRQLTRLSTRLVSSGLDRQTIAIENVEFADLSLRFVVRAANANLPMTEIELTPKGAVA